MSTLHSHPLNIPALFAKIDRNLQEPLSSPLILLVGDHSGGKSTLSNALAQRPLKGAFHRGRVFYEAADPLCTQYSPMSERPLPQTMFPRMTSLHNSITQVDTVSLSDKHNYLGSLSLAYSFQQLLLRGEMVMFLIVVPKDDIQSSERFLNTLLSFIGLFDYDSLPAQLKEELMNSTALVVTKTIRSEESEGVYYDQLQGLAQGWMHEDYRKQRKEVCIEFVNSILKRNMIGYFTKAIRDKPAPSLTLMDELSCKGWNPMNLAAVRKEHPGLVHNNFKKELDKMTEENKQKYDSEAKLMLQCFVDAGEIFKELIILAIQSVTSSIPNFSSFFSKIGFFLEKHDVYASEEKALDYRQKKTRIDFGERQGQATVAQKMKRTFKLIQSGHSFQQIEQVAESSFKERYEILSTKLSVCLEKMGKVCCSSEKQSAQFIDFSFVLLQTIHNLYLLNILDEQNRNGAHFDILNSLYASFDLPLAKVREDAINQILQIDERDCIFKTPQEHLDFIRIFEAHVQEMAYAKEDRSVSLIHLIQEYQRYSYRLKSENENTQLIQNIMKIDSQLRNAKSILKINPSLNQQSAPLADTISNVYLANWKLGGEVLMQDGEYDLAIEVFREIGDCGSVEQAYRQKWVSLDRGEEKNQTCLLFAEYSSTHGSIQRAMDVLKEAIRETVDCKATIKLKSKMTEMIRKREELMGEYLKEIEAYEPFFQQEKEAPKVLEIISRKYILVSKGNTDGSKTGMTIETELPVVGGTTYGEESTIADSKSVMGELSQTEQKALNQSPTATVSEKLESESLPAPEEARLQTCVEEHC